MAEIITDQNKGKFFTLFIDGKEYHVSQTSMTGAEIMNLGSIPIETGLILCNVDGTEEQVKPEDIIEFDGPGRRFKKAPKFKRG